MASKGQKFKKYTIELKEEIHEKYYKGEAEINRISTLFSDEDSV